MIEKFALQFKKFSGENFWIYLIFFLALIIVFITGRGNILEIIFLFILNILGNICFMLMLDSNKEKNFSIGAVYFSLGNIFFITLTLYGYIQNGELQYLLWQASFVLGGIKNVFRYCFQRDFFFINSISLGLAGIIIVLYTIKLGLPLYGILQSIGFAGVTTGLVFHNDTYRFFLMFLGTLFIVGGSTYGVILNYINGELLGITLSYALLTLATFTFYIKLLPNYISRFNKL